MLAKILGGKIINNHIYFEKLTDKESWIDYIEIYKFLRHSISWNDFATFIVLTQDKDSNKDIAIPITKDWIENFR